MRSTLSLDLSVGVMSWACCGCAGAVLVGYCGRDENTALPGAPDPGVNLAGCARPRCTGATLYDVDVTGAAAVATTPSESRGEDLCSMTRAFCGNCNLGV